MRLELAAPVEGLAGAQPSGLCFAEGRLIAVSDKHDTAVYRVETGGAGGAARLAPHLEFRAPPRKGARALDFEAVLFEPQERAFYLASEKLSDLLRVDAVSGEARWLGLGLPRAGEGGSQSPPLPFLLKPNAGIEGVAFLENPARFLLAAEREPRGLLILARPNGGGGAPEWLAMERSAVPLSGGRLPDYSDLAVFNGKVFALSRNAEAVVELAPPRSGRVWRERRAWSFSAAARDPQFAYAHTAFGMAEGLAVTPDAVWIVLDNNRSWRAAGAGDRRPLLFRFARPADME